MAFTPKDLFTSLMLLGKNCDNAF